MEERGEHSRVILVNSEKPDSSAVNALSVSRSLDLLEVVEAAIADYFKGRVFDSTTRFCEAVFYRCWLQIDLGERFEKSRVYR
jgi:hypothetical protein